MWTGAYLVSSLLVAASAATLPSPEPDATTTTEEPELTGDKWFGDKCTLTSECAFRGSVCDKNSCVCRSDLPATNHYDKCGPLVDINGTCFFNAQCEMRTMQTECRDNRCTCMFEMKPVLNKQNQVECIADYVIPEPERYIDPTMIGVLVGMALMFVIICIVLRLFAKARWRENRTIFNTPNPRLMNVSLLRETKPGTGERRGSRGSTNKPPSRQPSLASLRPTSPAQSQAAQA